MKKLTVGLVMALALLLVVGTSAFADELYVGTGTVDSIELYEGNHPIMPCDLDITFTTAAGQTYNFPVTADGEQLNLALLEAYLSGEVVTLDLTVVILPFSAKITAVEFGGI